MTLDEGSAILLGRYGGKYLSLPGSEHVALYAPTRSGKGVSCVIPNCLTWLSNRFQI
jgi:type IV secretion system protein VirD4